MTPEESRQIGHQLIDWIADYRDALSRDGDLPVMSQVAPGEIRARLPASPPQEGEPFATILEDVDRLILPGISHWQHPRFFAYFPGNASLASVLGDLLSSGLGVLGLSWQSSPALTELEETVTDWMRQLLGLSAAWSGVIQDSASTSTLVALLPARERATDHSQARGGLQAEPRPLVVYSSTQSHSSVEKAALLAGFGRENVRAIATDEEHALSVDALARAIEGADSLVLNPHKWLGAVFDCSLYYVRDPQHLIRVMSTNPSYLQTAADAQVKNLRDWGIPLGRRFRALKLWFLIREQGVAGLQARLRRDIENARWLAEQVDAAPDWKRLAPVPLQTVALRHQPPGLEGEALDRHTLAWVERVNRSGRAYLTPAMVDGRWLARVSVGAEATERADVEALWGLMRAEAARD